MSIFFTFSFNFIVTKRKIKVSIKQLIGYKYMIYANFHYLPVFDNMYHDSNLRTGYKNKLFIQICYFSFIFNNGSVCVFMDDSCFAF